jgi:hypothetical protein
VVEVVRAQTGGKGRRERLVDMGVPEEIVRTTHVEGWEATEAREGEEAMELRVVTGGI